MSKDVYNKEYTDALNRERDRTNTAWLFAVSGTTAATLFGILRATSVLAATFEKRMDTTNEWRGALEDQAKEKATVQQFDQLKESVSGTKAELNAIVDKTAGGRIFMGSIVQNISSIGTLIGIAYLIFGGK